MDNVLSNKNDSIKDKKQPEKIKLVLVGDGNSGKTSMLISYTTDRFSLDYVPTVFDSYVATIKRGQKIINLELWDTAGQD